MGRPNTVNICVTIDTEGDSANNPHSTFFGIEIIIPQLIELFDKYNIRATFFIQEDDLLQVGTNFLKFWKWLESHRHEIGSHVHGLIRAPIKEKEDIITKAIMRLKKLGFSPISFRAGRYYFNSSLIKVLEKNNIKFDSSVLPGIKECFKDGTVRCDHISAPHWPYFLSYENHCLEGNSKILELPINRYPKLPYNRWAGILTGETDCEEVLFDYFYEIRKDKLIIIHVHSWSGLSSLFKRFVRNDKNGKIKRFIFESVRMIINKNFLINSLYIERFENLLKYISKKNNVLFSTIREAGESIIRSNL